MTIRAPHSRDRFRAEGLGGDCADADSQSLPVSGTSAHRTFLRELRHLARAVSPLSVSLMLTPRGNALAIERNRRFSDGLMPCLRLVICNLHWQGYTAHSTAR